MKDAWMQWFDRAKQAKKASGKTDAEIAAVVGGVERAQVNHWFLGRREPKLSQFFALCEAVNADPLTILFGEKHGQKSTPLTRSAREVPQSILELARRISALPPSARKTVLDFVAGKEAEDSMGNETRVSGAASQ